MNRGLLYLLPSTIFLAISVATGIRHNAFHNTEAATSGRLLLTIVHSTCWIMFDYRRLTSCFKSIYVLLKVYLRSTVGQIRLCSIAIINIEKFYANHIL